MSDGRAFNPVCCLLPRRRFLFLESQSPEQLLFWRAPPTWLRSEAAGFITQIVCQPPLSRVLKKKRIFGFSCFGCGRLQLLMNAAHFRCSTWESCCRLEVVSSCKSSSCRQEVASQGLKSFPVIFMQTGLDTLFSYCINTRRPMWYQHKAVGFFLLKCFAK